MASAIDLPKVNRVLRHLKDAGPQDIRGQPMAYQASDALDKGRLDPGIADAIETLDGDAVPPHALAVLKAALYTGIGGLDEAHNLVTPLSWGAPTPFAGPPVRRSPARNDATYVHALVHRCEGEVVGEAGTGFSNCRFWWSQVDEHPVCPPPPPLSACVAARCEGPPTCSAAALGGGGGGAFGRGLLRAVRPHGSARCQGVPRVLPNNSASREGGGV